jgi:2,3-bisphosphoglycerate-dependent phosphoglycerate mutase
MPTEIVFETHSTTEDNENGVATGWLPGTLSSAGREQAEQLGRRRANDGVEAIFTSDLKRALETVDIAFADSGLPVLHDWRLRECDYGELNGARAVELRRSDHLTTPTRAARAGPKPFDA